MKKNNNENADSNFEIFKQPKNIYYNEENKGPRSTQMEKETEDKFSDFDGNSKRYAIFKYKQFS